MLAIKGSANGADVSVRPHSKLVSRGHDGAILVLIPETGTRKQSPRIEMGTRQMRRAELGVFDRRFGGKIGGIGLRDIPNLSADHIGGKAGGHQASVKGGDLLLVDALPCRAAQVGQFPLNAFANEGRLVGLGEN